MQSPVLPAKREPKAAFDQPYGACEQITEPYGLQKLKGLYAGSCAEGAFNGGMDPNPKRPAEMCLDLTNAHEPTNTLTPAFSR